MHDKTTQCAERSVIVSGATYTHRRGVGEKKKNKPVNSRLPDMCRLVDFAQASERGGVRCSVHVYLALGRRPLYLLVRIPERRAIYLSRGKLAKVSGHKAHL